MTSADSATTIRDMTEVDASAQEESLVEVRATVHLQRLQVGATALVDPNDPYVAELLEHRFLMPTGREAARSDGT